MEEYESKAIIHSIRATSRASVKIRDNFYTLEYCEERLIPDTPDVDLNMERQILWEMVNGEVDQQIEETYEALKNNR